MNRMSVLFFSFILFSISLSQTPPYGYSGNYAIVTNEPQQIIKGLGVEIQSDSIGSGDHGLPDEVVCVPHDLVDSEKMRFYTELLKGFRYVRLAMGLYLRGLDSSQQHIIERYPGQMESLYNLSVYSGVEGYAIEYWSPPPYWKSSNSYINGGLKSYNESFLDALGDAMIADIDYLLSFNLSVVMWGLQNEPGVSGVAYSSCAYSSANYHTAFKVIAPKVKAKYPNMYIHVDSYGGQSREVEIVNDPSVHQYFDAWTWHRIGDNSNELLDPAIYNNNTLGKDVFSNEYEYFSEATNTSCINTAQNIMNWFTFVNSPTWFWLHALKPTYNAEASGYGLGYWRPWDDNNTSPDHFPNLQKGYWEYNYLNWNSVAGFTKYMGWDAQRFLVKEDTVRPDQRILSFATSNGALVFVLTNRGNYTFTFNLSVDNLKGSNTFAGHLYTPSQGDVSLGSLTLDPNTPASRPVEYLSIEFWVQQI